MGGGYSVLLSLITNPFFSNFFPLASLIISFFIEYRQNRLLLESFIELLVEDLMIYQLVKKRTEILATATFPSEHAHLGTTWVFGGQLGFAWANLLGPKWA